MVAISHSGYLKLLPSALIIASGEEADSGHTALSEL